MLATAAACELAAATAEVVSLKLWDGGLSSSSELDYATHDLRRKTPRFFPGTGSNRPQVRRILPAINHMT